MSVGELEPVKIKRAGAAGKNTLKQLPRPGAGHFYREPEPVKENLEKSFQELRAGAESR